MKFMKKYKLVLFIATVISIFIVIALLSKKVTNRVNENHAKNLNKITLLSKEDLSSMSDEDLIFMVIHWMWSKFNSDWSNQYAVISSLPKACQDIYSVYTIEAEVNNGGFNQCYYNSSKEFTLMAESGFKAIGAEGFTELMIRANTIYVDIKDDLEKFNDGTIESFAKSYENNPLNDLDEEFMKTYEEEPLSKLCAEYIRENFGYFGD